jgi:hypothetical protein
LKEPYERRFPNLRNKSRAEQKRMLKDAIAKARAGEDEELMSHPAIETGKNERNHPVDNEVSTH